MIGLMLSRRNWENKDYSSLEVTEQGQFMVWIVLFIIVVAFIDLVVEIILSKNKKGADNNET